LLESVLEQKPGILPESKATLREFLERSLPREGTSPGGVEGRRAPGEEGQRSPETRVQERAAEIRARIHRAR
jgi:hypothetical protein